MQLTKNYKLHQYTDPDDRFNKEDFNSTFKKIDDAVGDLQETFNVTTKESFITKENVDEMKALNITTKENIDNLIMLNGINADSKVNLTKLTSENADAKVTRTGLTSVNADSKLTLNGLTLLNTDAKATLNSLNSTNITAKDILDRLTNWVTTGENILSMDSRIGANTTKLATFDNKMLEQESRVNSTIEQQNVNIASKISTAETNLAKVSSDLKIAVNEQLSVKASESDPSRLTTNKTVTGAINELFTNASSGKTLVANAVTNKGVVASADDTFTLLADKIGQINTGKKFAKSPSTLDIDAYSSTFSVSGLDFKPKYIIVNHWNVNKSTGSFLNGSDTYYIFIYPSIAMRYATDTKSSWTHSIYASSDGFTTTVYPSNSGSYYNYLTWVAIE